MRRPALLLRALFAGAALPALAAAQAPAARPAAPAARAAAPTPGAAARATRVASVEGITEYRLPNGLRVLLFPDASQPTATVNITYFVGSAREGYGETGMAHLLEHLVFKGTPRHPNIPQELTSHGARPNGTTWYDRTNYFETVPAIDTTIAWALDLEADRMVNSHIAKKDLESEFSVVRNEFEMGENSPFRVLLERAMSSAFLWHGYGRSTIGNRSDIEKVPIDRLQAFYRKYYQPDNAMLVVAGKFDEARMLQLVEEKFGRIPRPARTLDPSWTLEPTQDGERMVALRRVGDVQLASATYHVPAGAHPDFAAVAVLTEVLGSNPAGRLYKALIESKKAASAAAFAFQLREPGMLYAYTQVRRDDSLAVAQQALLGALDGVVTTPPTADEVARARTTLLKNWELTFNNAERVALQLSEWAANGDWRLIFLHRDRLEKVTPADVQRVAAAYLKPANRTVAVFVPTDKPDRAEIPPAPDVGLMVGRLQGARRRRRRRGVRSVAGERRRPHPAQHPALGAQAGAGPEDDARQRGGRLAHAAAGRRAFARRTRACRRDARGDARARHAHAHPAAVPRLARPAQGARERRRQRHRRVRQRRDGARDAAGPPPPRRPGRARAGARRARARPAALRAARQPRGAEVRAHRARPGGLPAGR
jgi:zinc protease